MPIPLRKLVKTLNFEKRHKRDYLSLWDNLSFLFTFSFLTCSIWREYLMTRRGRFQMPSGRLTFPIHNLCDQNRQKSIKKSEFWNFVKFWKKILKRNFLTEKRPQAVGGGNLDSGHEATIESLLGLVVYLFFQGYTKFWKFFYEMEMVTYCLSFFYLHTYSK